MTDYRTFFAGKYLTAPELVGDVVVEIVGWKGTDVENPDDNTTRFKVLLSLKGLKPWLPSRTAADCIAAMFGKECEGWVGKRVILYHDPTVKVGKEIKGGIRVRGGDIPKPIVATITLPRKKPFDVRLSPIDDPVDLEAFLAESGLTIADLDAHRAESNPPKPPVGSLSDDERNKLTAFYRRNPAKLPRKK